MLGFPGWEEEARSLLQASTSVALGVFDLQGTLLHANRGMRELLGGDAPAQPRAKYLVNPGFDELLAMGGADGLLFDGLLTVGDRYRLSRTVSARIHRRKGTFFIGAEYDVLELDHLNRELSRTNQEINNLQRELMQKNRLLEQTLAELRRTQSMLIHAEKMKALGQLVAGVAHEINNPLGFVSGNLHSLKENVTDLRAGFQAMEALALGRGTAQEVHGVREIHGIDDAQDELEQLFGATQGGLGRIKALVENLRTFSRFQEAQRKEVDLRESIESTLALAGPQIREKRIRVVANLDELPPVECYPAELNQVFMNLIVNAIQAMETEGTLSVAGRLSGEDQVELAFTDTGHGIDPEALGKVFDPFYTTKQVGSGTGLGLSIAHEIVTKHHGGRIEASSSPGRGACFTLRLPLRLPEASR